MLAGEHWRCQYADCLRRLSSRSRTKKGCGVLGVPQVFRLVGPPSGSTRNACNAGWCTMEDPKEPPFNSAGCLARLYWMFFGNIVLSLLLFFILEKRPIPPFLLDSAYFVAGLSLVLTRYVDIRFLHGQTGDGKPATMEHFQRYALWVCAAGAGVWLLARSLVRFL